jgi:hypothetical protein
MAVTDQKYIFTALDHTAGKKFAELSDLSGDLVKCAG